MTDEERTIHNDALSHARGGEFDRGSANVCKRYYERQFRDVTRNRIGPPVAWFARVSGTRHMQLSRLWLHRGSPTGVYA
jgi:hypothetical protein